MKTCIVSLDIINDICNPNGKLARFADRVSKNNIINHANRVIAWGRQHNHLITHVKVGFSADYVDCSSTSPMFSAAKQNQVLQLSTWGTEFCEGLDVRSQDPIIVKHRVSAFYGTDLELILRANRIERLVLLGVATNNAVELTAREAHDRDFYVEVIADATETINDEEKNASLNVMQRIAKVLQSDQLT